MPRHSLYALLSLNSLVYDLSYLSVLSTLELLCITFFQLLNLIFALAKLLSFYPSLERPDFKLICYLCLFPFLLNF